MFFLEYFGGSLTEEVAHTVDKNIKTTIKIFRSLIEKLRSTIYINNESTLKDQEMIFQKFIKKKFEENNIFGRLQYDKASFKFIFFDIFRSVLHGVIPIRSIAALNHVINKEFAEKGVFPNELIDATIKMSQ